MNEYEKEIAECYAEIERLKTRIALLEAANKYAKYQELEQNDEYNRFLQG